MKKWLRISLTILLAMTVLIGCTGNDTQLPNKPENSDKFAQESTAAESSAAESSASEESSEPEQSSKPEESSEPEQSSKPEESSEPEQSSKPEESSEPEQSSKPEESSQPEQSSKPEESSEPVSEPEPEPEPEPTPTPTENTGKFYEIQWHTGQAESDPYIRGGDADPLNYQGGMIGEYLFNADGLKIWVNSCYTDEAGYHWSIGYENGRPEDSFFVTVSDFLLNGVALDPWWSLMIEPSSSGYSDMTWTYYTLLQTPLHEITIGDFNLTIEVQNTGFKVVDNQPYTIQTGTGIPYYYAHMPIAGAPDIIIYDNNGMTILATWYDGYEGTIIQELVFTNGSDPAILMHNGQPSPSFSQDGIINGKTH